MSARVLFVCFVVGCAAVTSAQGADPADADHEAIFARGRVLLQQGDFDGTLQAFTEAARLAPDNEEYRQQAGLVRRVIAIRKRLDETAGQEQWSQMALALHTYYEDNDIHTEALDLGRKIHKRLNNAESAALLARSQLVLKMNEEAAELLSGMDDAQVTPETKALLGIALAREAELDKARALSEEIKLTEDSSVTLAFDVARLRALIGDKKGATGSLAHCFKATTPSRLDAVKAAARECPDFATLAGGEAFATALKTESEVKESSCSSGSACGKCPSRTKCASAGSKDDKKDGCAEKP